MKKKIIIAVLILAIALSVVFAFTLGAGADAAEPSLSIGGKSLVLGNSIYIRYMVAAEGVADINDVSLLVWNEPQDAFVKGTEKYEVKWVKGTTTNKGVTYYHFEFEEVAAKRLADDFYAVVYTKVGDKEYYSAPNKYSVLQYAYNMMGKLDKAPSTTEGLIPMLEAMLEYGAKAQYYFDNYRTDRLANADFYQVKTVGGKLADGFADGLYIAGNEVTIIADAPAEGYEFVGWQNKAGKIVSADATATITVGTANEVYTALYHSHTPTVSKGYAATCTTPGLTDGSYCSGCGKVFVEQTVIKEKGHSYESTVIPPDCTAEGYTMNICSNCDDSYVSNRVPALGHTFGDWVTVKEATDTAEGLQERYCACGESESKILERLAQPLDFSLNADGESYAVIGIGKCTDSEIKIPEMFGGLPVTVIDEFAFGFDYNIEKIFIPASVTAIKDWALVGCGCLTEIEVDPANETYMSVDGVLYTKDGKTLVQYPGGKTDAEYTILEGTVTVGYLAAYEAQFVTVTIPASVTTISESAFDCCYSLSKVIYNDSMTAWNKISIASGNDPLLSANLETAVTHSEGLTFKPTANNTAYTLTGIGTCADVDVIIPLTYLDKPVISISPNAFAGSNVKSVTVLSNITEIANGAFAGCDTLEAIIVDLSNSVYSSVDGTLYNKAGTKLIRYASGKTATSFSIPTGVTEIATEAFSGCKNLSSVTVGANVNTIGEKAFFNCFSLTSITVSSSNANFSSKNGILYNKNATLLITYAGSGSSFSVPAGVVEIGAYSFANASKLVSVEISDTVEFIGIAAFKGCSALNNVVISDGVSIIESYAFADCISLSEVTIGERVYTIGDYAFSGCTALETVYYNDFEEAFDAIDIGGGNTALTSANIIFAGEDVSDGVVGDSPMIGT